MTFAYKNPSLAPPDFTPQGFIRQTSQEQFSGSVQGLKASDLEERFSHSWDKLSVGYDFRQRISPLMYGTRQFERKFTNLPGELEIDFLTYLEQVTPVLVDGEISHFYTPQQKLVDIEKTAAINDFGKSQGWAEAVRVPFVDIWTPEQSDATALRIIQHTYVPTYVSR